MVMMVPEQMMGKTPRALSKPANFYLFKHIFLMCVTLPLSAAIVSHTVGHVGITKFFSVFAALSAFLWTSLAVLMRPSKNTNWFLSSGKTPPATATQELILRRKGGRGNSYWSDASVAFGMLRDFSYKKGRTLDFEQLLKDKAAVIGPYCIDDETRSVIMVEVEAGFDPAEVGPFYFQSQRDNAIRLYQVPFEEYHRVVANLEAAQADVSKALFVYNVSRCGSTLLSKCMDKLTNVRSISEPDILTGITHIASEAHGSRDEDLIKLARSSTKLLCYLRRERYPECETVCIKLRFQTVYVADLIHKACPTSKAMFLYRSGLDVVDSMAAAFINTGLYRVMRRIGMDILFIFYISDLLTNLPKLMPVMYDEKRFPQERWRKLGAVLPFVFSWMSVMEHGEKFMRANVIKAAIRYEDLVVGRTALVCKMLKQLGMLDEEKVDVTKADNDQAEDVFRKDAHEGTTTFSRRSVFDETTGTTKRTGYAYLRGKDEENIKDIFAMHETIQTSDYIIDGTITL